MTSMTKTERAELTSLVKKRERVMKTAAAQRSAELLADAEAQLAAIYHYDQDETWRAAYEAAEEEVAKAKAIVAERCRELGIPKRFSPSLDVSWYRRGETACKDRRAELRNVAKTRIAAIEARAKAEIEKISLEAQTEIVAGGLTTEAAQQFLAKMGALESLMPALDMQEVAGLLGKEGDA